MTLGGRTGAQGKLRGLTALPAAAGPAHEPVPEAEEQDRGAEAGDQRLPPRRPRRRLRRDDDALALQVPSDGTVHGLRRLIERLDSGAIEVEGLSVRSADLDDVFLSLTGSANANRADDEVPTP